MTAYTLSPLAQADIAGIWDYTEARWGAAQAERYVRELQCAIERAAGDPDAGRPCDDIRPGYRRISAGAHVLFFRRVDDQVIIMRVLHGRMDFERHL